MLEILLQKGSQLMSSRNKIKFDISTFSNVVYTRGYESIRQFAMTAPGLKVNYKTILRAIKSGYISYRTQFRLANALHCPLGYLHDYGNDDDIACKSILLKLESNGATRKELWELSKLFHKYGLLGRVPLEMITD